MKDNRPCNVLSAKSFALDIMGLEKPVTNNKAVNKMGIGIMSHLGKMTGIDSLNGGLFDEDGNWINTHCQCHVENGGDDCICHYCYATEMSAGGHTSVAKGVKNYALINSKFWNYSKVPAIKYNPETGRNREFRFNAVDDLDTAIGLINYLMICEKTAEYGSKTAFALWTKNNDILDTVFNKMRVRKPSNLIIMYSSDRVNHVAPVPDNAWYIDGIFTVWKDRETCEKAGHVMNCCDEHVKRVCHTCEHSCYRASNENGVFYRNELLRA